MCSAKKKRRKNANTRNTTRTEQTDSPTSNRGTLSAPTALRILSFITLTCRRRARQRAAPPRRQTTNDDDNDDDDNDDDDDDDAAQDEFSIFPSQYAIGVHGYVLVYAGASPTAAAVRVSLSGRRSEQSPVV